MKSTFLKRTTNIHQFLKGKIIFYKKLKIWDDFSLFKRDERLHKNHIEADIV
jgi:hypothetical protein